MDSALYRFFYWFDHIPYLDVVFVGRKHVYCENDDVSKLGSSYNFYSIVLLI